MLPPQSLSAKILWHCWSVTRHDDSWTKLSSAVTAINSAVVGDDVDDDSMQAAKENVERCLLQYKVWHPEAEDAL